MLMKKSAFILLAALSSANASTFGPDQFIKTQATRHASFFVGGNYNGPPNEPLMYGQMYVQAWAPEQVTQPYPLVLFHGFGQTATSWISTPDGREGWADYFVSQGYAVYMVDQPNRGRSGWQPQAEDEFESLGATRIQQVFTATRANTAWPQAARHTQWPGTGQRGDGSFDEYYASTVPSLRSTVKTQTLVRDAAAQLLDKIGPAILLTHSQAGLFGWSIADARPQHVKAIVSLEPSGPPLVGPPRTNNGQPWGITDIPLRYAPAVTDPKQISAYQQAQPDAPGLTRCWLQREPARQLVNLKQIPVLVVSAEASYHAPYDHCTAAYLTQAGVPTTFWRLEDFGINGNGHMMMLEKNNLEIAAKLNEWMMSKAK